MQDLHRKNWHSKRALEYSNRAYELAKEAHNKSARIETLSQPEHPCAIPIGELLNSTILPPTPIVPLRRDMENKII